MATINQQMPTPIRKFDSPQVYVAPAAGQTFVAGQPVALNAGGLVVAAATAAASVFGFAMAPAVDPMWNTPFTLVPVLKAKAGMRFYANLNGILSQVELGAQYGIIVNANGVWVIDPTNVTEKVFEIISLGQIPGYNGGGIGDTNPVVEVALLSGAVA